MIDNLDPRERQPDVTTPRREAPVARPLSDREVPLAGDPRTATIHAWLDGDLPESEARRSGATRDVDFWLRIEKEVEVRREMKTPLHVYNDIMAALPQSAPEALAWWKRPITVTPMVAMATTAGAVAVGIAIGAAIARGR